MSFKEVSLGECIEIIIDNRGKTPKKMGGDWVDRGIKTISAKNIHGGELTHLEDIRFVDFDVYKKWMKIDIKRGDCLLVSEGATLGENMYWDSDEKVVLGQRLFAIRTNNEILDSKYFSAYMNTIQYQKEIEGRATGTSVLGLRQTELLNTKVLIRPIEEQRFIGNLYHEINKKIEVNNKINRRLEDMAQAIFKHWFIDFEFPNEEGKPYKSSGGEMVESELGMIPKGWEVKQVKDFGEVITGKTPSTKKEENYGDKYPFITIPDMHNSMYINKTARYLSEEGNNVQPKKLIPKDSLIVSCIATVGLVSINTLESHTNQQINSIVPNNKELLPYLYFDVKSKSEYLNLLGSAGTTTKNVNKTSFENIKLLFPNENTLQKYYYTVQHAFKKIEKNIIENERLVDLRDNLLPKLMSGEIRVQINN